jgi:pyruvate dehydrogenase E2 component (dihydrolipoamide acetyltransferase)
MAEAIRLGRMTDTMDEGFIAEISVKVGDVIKTGDAIAEVETDKATLPLESYYAGTVLHVAAKKGDSLKIGDLIAVVGKQGEDFASLLEAPPKAEGEEKAAEKPEAEEKKEMPENDGEVSQEKASPEKGEKDAVAESKVTVPAASTTDNADGRLKASPLAKKIAADKGIDLNAIQGSGEEGRIVKRDLDNAKPAAAGAFGAKPFTGKESFKDVRVSQMRKTIAKRLSQSKSEAPHFYLTMDINMDKATELRTSLNNIQPQKVSFNDLVIKAVAIALRENPAVNTSWLGDAIRYNEHIHIGMAVAVEDGLLVPVIRFADSKSIPQIGAEAKALAQKATAKKLLPEDMQGNTFTISNLGMFGIEEFTAIINTPDAAILAVGAIRDEVAVANGAFVAVKRMKVTLSSDHRVIDGATGAKFLQSLKAALEEPLKLVF